MDFSENTYYRTILDAIPIPVFVVDGDVRIRDLNDVPFDSAAREGRNLSATRR